MNKHSFANFHKYNGNNILWVEYWKQFAKPNDEFSAIQKEKLSNGEWYVEIEIPLVNTVLEGQSKDLIAIIVDLADEAALLINRYKRNHPEVWIDNIYENARFVVVPSESGDDYLIIEDDYLDKKN